jgi:hypothetical protein
LLSVKNRIFNVSKDFEMNKFFLTIVWSVGCLCGFGYVYANDTHFFDAMHRVSLPQPQNLIEHWLLVGQQDDEASFFPEEQIDLLAVLEEHESLQSHMDALCELVADMAHAGKRVPYVHFQRRDVTQMYPIRLLLEALEREYPQSERASLDEEQRALLLEVYSEIIQAVRLMVTYDLLLPEDERAHIPDVLGLLIRVSGARADLRVSSFQLFLQGYLLEHRDYRIESYINACAQALASGNLLPYQVHAIRSILINCLQPGASARVHDAAARAIGVYLAFVPCDEASQAELVKLWVDLVFVHGQGARAVRSVIQGMCIALRGQRLSPGVHQVIFESLLLFRESGLVPQFSYGTQVHLAERMLLDTWAEGLVEGWFSPDEVLRLVPVIMSYRFLTRCTVRTEGVVAALIGLLHARAEDSAFRQLVYDQLAVILFLDGQSEGLIAEGMARLCRLFTHAELSGWERVKIIAYFETLSNLCSGYYLSSRYARAIAQMLNHASLSSWERLRVLSLMQEITVYGHADLEMQQEEILQSVHAFGKRQGGVSSQEMDLIKAIVMALPEEDDDLDYEDDHA